MLYSQSIMIAPLVLVYLNVDLITAFTPASQPTINPIRHQSFSESYSCLYNANNKQTEEQEINTDTNLDDIDLDVRTPEEEAFFAKTKALCAERNLPLQNVKNARDLASVSHSPIPPDKVFRTGRLSDASDPEDTDILLNQIGFKTMIDLRSPTELKDDVNLERKEIYGDFANLVWSERRGGLVRELNKDEPRIVPKNGDGKLHLKDHVKTLVGGIRSGVDVATHLRNKNKNNTVQEVTEPVKYLVAAADLAGVTSETEDGSNPSLIVQPPAKITMDTIDEDGGEENEGCNACDDDDDTTACRFVKEYLPGEIQKDTTRNGRKERHFVSLMNELKYVRGTLSKLRKRDIAKVLIQSPGAIVSRRVRANCKDVFLSEINAGGLPMLNELVLQQAAPGIKYVLDLMADPNRYPIAFYCTAGKDRTGIISAIILSLLGVADEDIVEDYSLSANVYAEMNDHKAMVGALSQRNLNAKTFLGAPPHVMSDTLEIIRKEYGNVEGYLDSIGFYEEDREKLKHALLSQ